MKTPREGSLKSYSDWYKSNGYNPAWTSEECDFIESMLQKYRIGGKRLLDLGCGPGRHLIEMTARGYHVTGVDINEHMLKGIVDNCPTGSATVICKDILDIDFNEEFSCAYMFFNTIALFTQNADLISLFDCVFKAIEREGIFIVQLTNLWDQIAEGELGSGVWEEVFEEEGLTKRLTTILEMSRFTNRAHFTRITETRSPGKNAQKFVEEYEARIFSPDELELAARISGFSPVGAYGNPKAEEPLSNTCCEQMLLVFRKD